MNLALLLVRSTMLALLTIRSCSAFTVGKQALARSGVKSRLEANLLGDLTQKAFSAMSSSNSKYFTIGITGSSGLLGTAVIDELTQSVKSINGKPLRILKMKRGDSVDSTATLDDEVSETTIVWNPKASLTDGVISPNILEEMDAVIHLAGENVATGLGPLGFVGIRPWTEEKKAEILNSRVIPTRALANAIQSCKTPTTLIAASGVGIYGDNFMQGGPAIVDETMDTSSTDGFLADVSRQWEDATTNASKGNRVVNARMGVVLSKNGGALSKLYPIFFLGGGGIVGSGNQYFTFISARDAARALIHVIQTPSLKGPVNICAPNPCTNADFTSAMGDVMNRPTLLPFPGFAASLLFGQMGEEMLLGGVRAAPGKLTKSGFQFNHPTIVTALQSAMEENI